MFATPSPQPDRGFAESETSRFHFENPTAIPKSRPSTDSDSSTHSSASGLADSDQIPRRRSSAFFEAGLEGEDALVDARIRRNSRPRIVRFRSKVEVVEPEAVEVYEPTDMPVLFPTLGRLLFFALLIAVVLPSLSNSPLLKAGIGPIGAKAGPVAIPRPKSLPQKRQNTATDICKRWSGQSAVVNGTLYYYGGRATTDSSQTSNTWSEWTTSL
jgi:hypothetical protein